MRAFAVHAPRAISLAPMYVCLCHGVSDRAVRDAVDAGVRDIAELGRRTRAGTDCGGCREKLEEILARFNEGKER